MNIQVAVITVSDRSSKGEREDLSGPAITKWAESKGFVVSREIIVPDEFDDIKNVLVQCSDDEIDLILTTGGTGFAPRDVTPEATRSVLDREATGFAEAMRWAGKSS